MGPRNNLADNNFTRPPLFESREGGGVLECGPDQISMLVQEM